ncbi:hypothetical protein [Vogesella indigofera]|uniref:hypothetical protein n=1 Tax=Vogesella indigofera TaxID=45465 RepID=UPI00234E77D4|nr:hypothetical protein [Vogesella indigofera]MDC7709041.1 hypothetical protein [Vogesella indigofera]
MNRAERAIFQHLHPFMQEHGFERYIQSEAMWDKPMPGGRWRFTVGSHGNGIYWLYPMVSVRFHQIEEIIDADDDLHDEAQLQSTLLTDLSEHPFRRWQSLLPPRRMHYRFTVLDEHFERDIQRALAGLQEIFLTDALPYYQRFSDLAEVEWVLNRAKDEERHRYVHAGRELAGLTAAWLLGRPDFEQLLARYRTPKGQQAASFDLATWQARIDKLVARLRSVPRGQGLAVREQA